MATRKIFPARRPTKWWCCGKVKAKHRPDRAGAAIQNWIRSTHRGESIEAIQTAIAGTRIEGGPSAIAAGRRRAERGDELCGARPRSGRKRLLLVSEARPQTA